MQPDFQKMMRDAQKNLQKMQEDMAKMQQELATVSVEGSSGGGAVRITLNGMSEFIKVKISPEAVDPADVETLEDLVLTALKDGHQKVQALVQERSGNIARSLNLPPGLGF